MAALAFDLPFPGPAARPHPGQLPADPGRADHGQQPGAVPGLVLGQAAFDVPRPTEVVAGVLVGPVKMEQIDRARLAGHGVTPAARATAVAIDRAFAAPMIDSR